MGVPAFYKWLVGKYPKVVEDAVKEKHCVDSSKPNPNGVEFDNLYLDMNGIIHPCFHPEDQINGPTNFEEVFSLIYEYIDGIFEIVRPRKLLYMAIDGVAPRAKMNQQRSRRYKTARDAELAEAEEARLREEFELSGKEVLPKEESELSDSNVITPGTVFMQKLAVALEGYIRDRLNNDPGWKSIKVILSDSSVPGEGEHKIMSFIRLQRSCPEYDPETRHCLYGLDADLIMLALATHEVNFFVLREDTLKHGNDNAVSEVCASLSKTEIGLLKPHPEEFNISRRKTSDVNYKKPYQFVNIWTLRECLKIDMCSNAKLDLEVDRIVDDFIFICFFTGNDFLPPMPSLDIHEGALDLLIHVYKKNIVPNGSLVDASNIHERKAAFMNTKRVEKFILEVGTYEEKIFKKRFNLRQANMRRFLNQLAREEAESAEINEADDEEHVVLYGHNRQKDISAPNSISAFARTEIMPDVIANTNELKQKLKNVIRNNSDLYKNGIFDHDKVKLGHDGWKSKYYKEKFSADNIQTEIDIIKKEVVGKYMEGLCWMLHYYFSGVLSWSWYYPFYYAPFASDLKGITCPSSAFKIGEPFKPYNQLMAVLPPRSSNALPKGYANLMKSENSPLLNFYPKDFEVDANGKRFTWQGVCKLPFIDEEKLLAATKTVENDLELEEAVRNSIGNDKIFVRDSNGLGLMITSLQPQTMLPVDTNRCGLNGYISLSSKSYTATNRGVQHEDHTLSAEFFNPDRCKIVPKLLSNVSELPEMNIKSEDIVERKLWHEHEKAHHPFITDYSRYTKRNTDLPEQSGPNDNEGHIVERKLLHEHEKAHHPFISNYSRYTSRNTDLPDQSGPNNKERHVGAGSGWGSRGRGRRTNCDASSSRIVPTEHGVRSDRYGANRSDWRHDSCGQGSRYTSRNIDLPGQSGPNDKERHVGAGSGSDSRGRGRPTNCDASSGRIVPAEHGVRGDRHGANRSDWRLDSCGQGRGRHGFNDRYSNSSNSRSWYGSRRDGGSRW